MSEVQQKLKDRSGATLTVALLFFIMCAAAGSVILAAATTSSGRLAEMKASDQNYYAVLSAAQLVRDELNGQTIAVGQTETKTVTETEKETTDKDGVKTTETTETTKYTYSTPVWEYPVGTTGTAITDTTTFTAFHSSDTFLLLDALKKNVAKKPNGAGAKGSLTNVDETSDGSTSSAASASDANTKTDLADPVSRSFEDGQDAFLTPLLNGSDNVYERRFTMTLKSGTGTGAGSVSVPSVDVCFRMNGQGSITAYFKNHSEAGTKKQGNDYRLMLTMDAKEGSVQKTTDPDSQNSTSEDGKEKKTETTTTTARHSYVTWGNPVITKDTSTDVWTD